MVDVIVFHRPFSRESSSYLLILYDNKPFKVFVKVTFPWQPSPQKDISPLWIKRTLFFFQPLIQSCSWIWTLWNLHDQKDWHFNKSWGCLPQCESSGGLNVVNDSLRRQVYFHPQKWGIRIWFECVLYCTILMRHKKKHYRDELYLLKPLSRLLGRRQNLF